MSLEEARDLASNCLRHHGCDEPNADAVAETMVRAEADRCHSHGLFRLPQYVQGLQIGRANGHAQPTVDQLAPAVIRVDGDSGFASLGLQVGRQPIVDLAKTNGIAALALTNMFHIAALWPEVEEIAEQGLCAFAFTNSLPAVAPAGGTKPLYGTNPMAFAWPRRDQPPLVFDQASSSMARGEVMIAARDGHNVPETAGIGPDGDATTDPNVVLAGAQLAFGGYKGAALAMMVELLAGPLIGSFLGFEAKEDDGGKGGTAKGGELILVLDPSRFGDPDRTTDQFLDHGEKLFAEILSQEGTRLPGQRRLQARAETARSGISIPESLHQTILGLM